MISRDFLSLCPVVDLGWGCSILCVSLKRDPSARLHYKSFRNLQRAQSHKSVDEVEINLLSPVKVGHFNFAHLGWPVKWMVPGVEMTTSNVDNGINCRSFSSFAPEVL